MVSITSILSLHQQQLRQNHNIEIVMSSQVVRMRRRRRTTTNTTTTTIITTTSRSSLLVLLIMIYCGCCYFSILSIIIPTSSTLLIDAFVSPIVLPRIHTSSSSSLSSSTLQATPQVTSSFDNNVQRTNSKLSSSVRKGIDTTSSTLNASIQLPTTSLSKSRTTTTSTSSKKQQIQQPQVKRLSVVEQQELFRHIMEVRRIRNIEMELLHHQQDQLIIEPILLQQPQHHDLSTPKISTLQLAQSTGYGNNIHEFNTALIVGQQAREQLITSNMGLIHYCINDILQYHTLRTITIDDLIQEGAIGLSRAVDKYNPSFYQQSSTSSSRTSSSAITTSSSTTTSSSSSVLTNAKFSTYAVYWIRAAILRTIRERDDIMRVPDHVTTAIKKISNVAQSFGVSLDNTSTKEFDDVPTSLTTTDGSKNHKGDEDIETPISLSSTYSFDNHNKNGNFDPDQYYQHENIKQMIVDKTGYTDQMVQNAILVRNRRNKYGTTVLSFESWMQQGKHYETDILVSPTIQNDNDVSSYYYEEPNQNGSIEHLKQILSRFLRPKEMEALSWRYGLNDLQQERQNNNNNTPITNSNPLAKRNYLAETEMELYGSTTTTTATSSKSCNISIRPTTSTNKQKDDSIVKGKWGEAMSFHEVGKQMQISAEYGRRLCHGALQKLRNAVAEGRLEPAILM